MPSGRSPSSGGAHGKRVARSASAACACPHGRQSSKGEPWRLDSSPRCGSARPCRKTPGPPLKICVPVAALALLRMRLPSRAAARSARSPGPMQPLRAADWSMSSMQRSRVSRQLPGMRGALHSVWWLRVDTHEPVWTRLTADVDRYGVGVGQLGGRERQGQMPKGSMTSSLRKRREAPAITDGVFAEAACGDCVEPIGGNVVVGAGDQDRAGDRDMRMPCDQLPHGFASAGCWFTAGPSLTSTASKPSPTEIPSHVAPAVCVPSFMISEAARICWSTESFVGPEHA